MKTYKDLQDALAAATLGIQYTKTLGSASDTFSGDGIGFLPLSQAVSLGFIIPDGRNDFIDAGAGNDVIKGYAGSDILIGGAGDDTVFGGPGSYASGFTLDGNNFVFGDSESVDPTFSLPTDGNDLLSGRTGSNDFIFGGGGNDVLFGGNFANVPNSGNDYLSGGPGSDILIPGDGVNEVDGGTTVPVSLSMPGLTAASPPVPPLAPPEEDIFRAKTSADYSFTWNPSDKYVAFASGDGSESDQIQNVEFARVSSDPTVVDSSTPDPLSQLTLLTQWTIQIRRYENGAGSLQLFMNGNPVPGADWSTESLGSSNPLALSAASGIFAFDDTTPIPEGDYQAIYRTDARIGKVDGPGTLELLGTEDLPVPRSAIQIHQLGTVAGWTTSSQGCYTIPLAGVQEIENLILSFAPQVATVTEAAGSVGSDNGITSGLLLGASPIQYWDLFWPNLAVDPSAYISQIDVDIVDISRTITQPKVVFGSATISGSTVYVPFQINDGGDNKLSKDIALDIKLSGAPVGAKLLNAIIQSDGRQDIFIDAGHTEGVLEVQLPAGSTAPFDVTVTGITPLDKAGTTYDEYKTSAGR